MVTFRVLFCRWQLGDFLISPAPNSETFWQSAYQKHGSALLTYLRVRIPDQADAEDILQETFVKAIRATEKTEEISKVRSYLFTIAHLQNRTRKVTIGYRFFHIYFQTCP